MCMTITGKANKTVSGDIPGRFGDLSCEERVWKRYN